MREEVEYRGVEVQSSLISNDLGDWVEQEVVKRGTTLAEARKQPRLIIETMHKHSLANYVKGLSAATTIVHIPHVTSKGEVLDMTQWATSLWYAAKQYGVPMYTQSSIKGNTFYCVERPMFDKLISTWDVATDGYLFAAYGALLFSEMDNSKPMSYKVKKFDVPLDGQDGNCAMPIEWGDSTKQFRFMHLNKEGIPNAIGKGIGMPLNGTVDPEFNTTQIKVGNAKGNYLVMQNSAVSAHDRPTKMWVSCEPLLMLKDTPEVRTFVSARVGKEVGDYLSLLTEARRVDLLRRLQGIHLENGILDASKRSVIDALRSKMPWCAEIEERVTRFAIKDICESIIPSGGISGWASLMVISDTHGVAPCKMKDAKVIAFRIPVTGSNAIIPLPRDPFKKGKGHVVTSEVAKRADGDSDGDWLVVIRDPEVVELFKRYLNTKIVTTQKPQKTRAKASLTPDFMTDLVIDQVAQSWQVGALNIAGWKMIQAFKFKEASDLLALANWQPMTTKWSLKFDGQEFAQYVSDVYNKHRKVLKDITLAWRDAAKVSRSWKSPREMADAGIEKPVSHLDICWNAGVKAAAEWRAANPLKPLSISRLARITFGERDMVIPGIAWRDARKMITQWGKYWAEAREAGTMDGDHTMIYRAATDWGRNASPEAIAAILVWRPQNPESSGFGLKWHAVFSAGRGTEVLGMNNLLAEALKEMGKAKQETQPVVEARVE